MGPPKAQCWTQVPSFSISPSMTIETRELFPPQARTSLFVPPSSWTMGSSIVVAMVFSQPLSASDAWRSKETTPSAST